MAASIRNHTKVKTFENPDSVGLRIGVSNESVIITHGLRHVDRYDTREYICEQSWTLKPGNQFSTNAISVKSKHIAVVNKDTLRWWDKSDKNIEKSKKRKLDKSVFKLIPLTEDAIAVVYEDGTLSLFQDDELGPVCGTQSTTNSQAPVWVSAETHSGKNHVIVIQNSRLKMYSFLNLATAPSIQEAGLDTDEASCKMCLYNKGDQLGILRLGKQGQLFWISLDGKTFGDEEKFSTLPYMQESCEICSLGNSQIAVVGIGHSKNPKVAGLAIWDCKFGVMQAWTELSEPSKSYQIKRCRSQLLVKCGKALYTFHYTAHGTTIGSALNMLNKAKQSEMVEAVKTGNINIESSIEALLDVKKTKDRKSFKSHMKKLISDLKSNPELVLATQTQMTRIIQRCLSEKSFWPAEELSDIIRFSFVPPSVIGEMCSVLCSRNDIGMLWLVVNHINNIPESSQADILKCALKNDENKFSEIDSKDCDVEYEDVTVNSPFDSKKKEFINHLLSLPFNGVFMLSHLDRIDFQHVLDLLQHLAFLLCTDDSRKVNDSGLNVIKVVDWISLLLDAHFTQIILSSDARATILQLHQIVENQMGFYEELIGLQGILAQLDKACSFPKQEKLGQYNIHTLHIA